jgi:hypothetical protein
MLELGKQQRAYLGGYPERLERMQLTKHPEELDESIEIGVATLFKLYKGTSVNARLFGKALLCFILLQPVVPDELAKTLDQRGISGPIECDVVYIHR